MDPRIKRAIVEAFAQEPFARALNMKLAALDTGTSSVEMIFDPDMMGNLFGRAHGGALFALIDEAFETSCQTHGTMAVALNVNVTYVSSPEPGSTLRAESREEHLTRKTATYDIKVFAADGTLVATCKALAYRTGKPLPFLKTAEERTSGTGDEDGLA